MEDKIKNIIKDGNKELFMLDNQLFAIKLYIMEEPSRHVKAMNNARVGPLKRFLTI
jgi:hypothetical protein